MDLAIDREFRFSQTPEDLVFSGLSDAAVRLFSALLRYANADWQCFPRQALLAERLGWSLAKIERIVRELREAGWLTTARLGRVRGVLYTLRRTVDDAGETAGDPAALTGGDPSPVRALKEREPSEREELPSGAPPRSAAVCARVRRREQQERDDALDPAKTLGLWPSPAGRGGARGAEVRDGWADEIAAADRPPRRRTVDADSPMGLALAWREQMQRENIAGALDTNLKALARFFAVWMREDITADQIRTMTGVFAHMPGLRNPAVAPWRQFLYQRHVLLDRVRRSARAAAATAEPRRYLEPDPVAAAHNDSERYRRDMAEWLATQR